MATTPKGIPVPDETDPPDGPAQMNDIAQWLDDNPGIGQLTYAQINALSGADLWVGRLVRQTDTGTNRPVQGIFEYNGFAWRLPWNLPWGEIAYDENTALAQNIGTTLTDIISVTTPTLTFVTNRLYEVRGSVGLVVQNTNPGLVKVQITDLSNNVVAMVVNKDCAATGRSSGERAVRLPGLTGSGGFKLRGLTSNDTMTVTGNTTDPGPVWISVRDLGPSGAPT